MRTSKNEYDIQESAQKLWKIDPKNSLPIKKLVELLLITQNDYILRKAVESLGKIGAGNPVAIDALVKLLHTSNDESILWQAAESLGKIGTGNPVAIDALVKLLHTSNDESILRQAAESLGKIDPGNPVVIEALVKLLRTNGVKEFFLNLISIIKKDFTQYIQRIQVAESLGKIDPGNPVAIDALVKLLRNSNNDSILLQAAESLGKIGTGNSVAIDALVKLLRNSNNDSILLQAAESLGKIGTGNPLAVEPLVKLLRNSNNDSILLQAAESLEKTDIFTRRTLLESYLDTYQRIITFALKKRDFKRLFLYTQIFRNRYLVERLAKQDIPLPNTVSSELSQQIQEAKTIEKKALNIYTNKLNESLPERELNQFAQQWDNAKADLEKLDQQVAKHEPEFIAKTKVTPLNYSEVQEILPSDTAIIEFFFTKYKLITLLILPGVESPRIPDALSVDLSSINLKDIADNWINNLSSQSKDKQEDIEKTKIDLDNIIDQLSIFLRFNQLLNFIPDNIKHLIIVPHNYLHLFPIHALWINKKENKRLIDKFSVSYFPSLQVWKICQKRQRSQQSLLAIENPTQDKDLIFAKAEIASISQHQNFNQQQTLIEFI